MESEKVTGTANFHIEQLSENSYPVIERKNRTNFGLSFS